MKQPDLFGAPPEPDPELEASASNSDVPEPDPEAVELLALVMAGMAYGINYIGDGHFMVPTGDDTWERVHAGDLRKLIRDAKEAEGG